MQSIPARTDASHVSTNHYKKQVLQVGTKVTKHYFCILLALEQQKNYVTFLLPFAFATVSFFSLLSTQTPPFKTLRSRILVIL